MSSTLPVGRLAVLAGATFVYVTFEVFPVGLIEDIAKSLTVPTSQVGLLISSYAVVAALATVPTVALASRFSRRTALVASLIVLVLAEILTAAATTFPMMVVSRLAAALTHGVVWSLIAPAAASLVPKDRVGTATAVVFGGSSLALVLGSPGTAFLGGLIGWRSTAVMLAVVTCAVSAAVLWALHDVDSAPKSERVVGTAGDPSVPPPPTDWRAVAALCGVSVLLVTGHFISYTYISVILGEIVDSGVVVFLTLYGIAGAVGTVLIGRFNDRHRRGSAMVTMAGFVVGLRILSALITPAPAAVAVVGTTLAVTVWGMAFAASGPVFQTAVMRAAPADADRVSSVYVTGMQVGIAGGSALGSAILGVSAGLLPVISAGLSLVVLVAVSCRFIVAR